MAKTEASMGRTRADVFRDSVETQIYAPRHGESNVISKNISGEPKQENSISTNLLCLSGTCTIEHRRALPSTCSRGFGATHDPNSVFNFA